MRKRNVLIGLTLVICAYFVLWRHYQLPHELNKAEHEDYQTLQKDLIGAFSSSTNEYYKYDRIFNDSRAFIEILSLDKKFQNQFGVDAATVLKYLREGRSGTSNKIALQDHIEGKLIFSGFKGRWRGVWKNESQSFLSDHAWHTPEVISGHKDILEQVVVMGEWNPITETRIGNTVALNVASLNTGVILGAVGVKNSRPQRPHVGFYLNESTLLWVALESDPEVVSEKPYYSIFLEKAGKHSNTYEIVSLGFEWDRKTRNVEGLFLSWGKYDRLSKLEYYVKVFSPRLLPGNFDYTPTRCCGNYNKSQSP